jgi:hypothetical protein
MDLGLARELLHEQFCLPENGCVEAFRKPAFLKQKTRSGDRLRVAALARLLWRPIPWHSRQP